MASRSSSRSSGKITKLHIQNSTIPHIQAYVNALIKKGFIPPHFGPIPTKKDELVEYTWATYNSPPMSRKAIPQTTAKLTKYDYLTDEEIETLYKALAFKKGWGVSINLKTGRINNVSRETMILDLSEN